MKNKSIVYSLILSLLVFATAENQTPPSADNSPVFGEKIVHHALTHVSIDKWVYTLASQ